MLSENNDRIRYHNMDSSLTITESEVPSKKSYAFKVSCLLLTMTFFGAFILSFFFPHYTDTDLVNALRPPSLQHPFGTDILGRCMLARCLRGMFVSLNIALVTTIIDLAIGLLVAASSILAIKKGDVLFSYFTNILHAVPRIPIMILILAIFQKGTFPLLFSMILTGWVQAAKIIRPQLLHISQKNFVLSARSMKASNLYLFRKHIFPNALDTIISTFIFTIPHAIYTEAFVSFLGLGVQAPQTSLGTLVKEGMSSLEFYPWLFFIPASITIAISVGFNLLGEHIKTHLEATRYG